MSSTGKLNGEIVLRATVSLPRFGIWWADVEVGNVPALKVGALVTLELASATFKGVITRGTPYEGRTWYHIQGGAGGWRKALEPKTYRAEIGVKLSTVVEDAAREVGETIVAVTDTKIGPGFTRPGKGTWGPCEASCTLDLVAESNWYVDEDGLTHVGSLRPQAGFKKSYVVIDKRPDRASVTVAAEDIAGLVPGAQLEGLDAAAVRHELTPGTLRSQVWGATSTKSSHPLIGLLTALIRQVTRPHWFHGLYRYAVVGGSGGYLDLVPKNKSIGLSDQPNVRVRVGVPGGRGSPAIGSTVLVGFVDGSPLEPFVSHFEGENGSGFVPTEAGLYGNVVKIGDASAVFVAKATGVSDLQTQINAWTPTGVNDGASLKAAIAAWLGSTYATTKGKVT